jgi:hypothetical protein
VSEEADPPGQPASRGRRRVCSISIDVDPLPCYYTIHSLGASPPALRSRILCASLPRYAALFAEHNLRATFFVVAQDIDCEALGDEAEKMRACLRQVSDAGHEIANHSYSHPYELARWPTGRVHEEIARAHELLSEFVGREIEGFRAPGYDVSAAMLETLVDLGYRYDSSVFPAPGYYLAKVLVMGALRALGRKSGAVVTNPRALAASIDPYRPAMGAPWASGDAPLWELPIAVTSRTRTPVIGTNLLLAPDWLRDHWLASMATRDFFNFEMHGIDLCDAQIDEMPKELVARQPDLRVGIETKLKSLGKIIESIAPSGSDFLTQGD